MPLKKIAKQLLFISRMPKFVNNHLHLRSYFFESNESMIQVMSQSAVFRLRPPSTRIRIRLNQQTFLSGLKSFRVHTYPETNRISPSTRIRIHSSVQDSSLNIVQQSMRSKKKITLFILGFWSSCEANFSEFDKYTAQLKTPTDRRQTSLAIYKAWLI